MVLLKYLGGMGNAASNRSASLHFRIGNGTAELFRSRAVVALNSLQDRVMCWPDEDERKSISMDIQSTSLLPNCVGLMDVTLLPLEFRPKIYSETYFTQKGHYALNMLVLCDSKAGITHYVVGWLGSVHDNRLWRNSDLHLNTEKYFKSSQYLLKDSAFTPNGHLISAFKSLRILKFVRITPTLTICSQNLEVNQSIVSV